MPLQSSSSQNENSRLFETIMYETTLKSQIRVRPNDLDTLGHVNNACILEYFELARWDWLKHFGLNQQSEILPVVASIQVNYRGEVHLGEVEIETELEANEKKYQVIFQQVLSQGHNNQSRLKAQGSIKVAFINAQTRTLCSIDDFLNHNNQVYQGVSIHA